MTRSTSMHRLAVSLCAFALVAACKTEKAPPQDSTRPTASAPGAGTATGPDSAAKKLGVLAQMKTPESAHYDADLDVWFVSNIDVVRVFDKRSGKALKTISLKAQKATFLNDVAVGGDSAVYVTDTGILFDAKGGMTHPGVNRIFRIAVKDNKVTEAATGDALENP